MKIAVIGTGMVGRAIAGKLAEVGNNVFMGTRDVKKTMSNTENTALTDWLSQNKDVQLKSFSGAAAQADVVVNCTKGLVSLDALKLCGAENLKGKVLVDIANPLDFSNGMPPTLNPVNDNSLGEQIQATFPDAKVVKTLNTMTASVMVNPSLVKGEHNVFVSGNDDDAKATTKDLLKSFGWTDQMIIDMGDITTARGSEMLLPIWVRLWGALGTAEFNFHIQKN